MRQIQKHDDNEEDLIMGQELAVIPEHIKAITDKVAVVYDARRTLILPPAHCRGRPRASSNT